jgi:hypothetical protein
MINLNKYKQHDVSELYGLNYTSNVEINSINKYIYSFEIKIILKKDEVVKPLAV